MKANAILRDRLRYRAGMRLVAMAKVKDLDLDLSRFTQRDLKIINDIIYKRATYKLFCYRKQLELNRI